MANYDKDMYVSTNTLEDFDTKTLDITGPIHLSQIFEILDCPVLSDGIARSSHGYPDNIKPSHVSSGVTKGVLCDGRKFIIVATYYTLLNGTTYRTFTIFFQRYTHNLEEWTSCGNNSNLLFFNGVTNIQHKFLCKLLTEKHIDLKSYSTSEKSELDFDIFSHNYTVHDVLSVTIQTEWNEEIASLYVVPVYNDAQHTYIQNQDNQFREAFDLQKYYNRSGVTGAANTTDTTDTKKYWWQFWK
jgi:hypothetical protein